MPPPLTRDTVLERVRDFPRENYLQIGSILKGVALAVASLVLLDIVLTESWLKLLPWAASLGALQVTHSTWGRGILLTNARANALDSVFPLLMGIAEFLLFGVLATDRSLPTNVGAPGLWLWWPVVMAAHAGLAVGLVHNRIRLTHRRDDFDTLDPQLMNLADRYVIWIGGNRKGAAICAGLAGAAAVGTLIAPPWAKPYVVAWTGALFVPVMAAVVWQAERQRAEIAELRLSPGPSLTRAHWDGRAFDTVEVVPAGPYTRPRTLVVVWDERTPNPFPIGTLTLDGPWVEWVEVSAAHRKSGHGLALLAYGVRLRGRPLVGDGTTEEGKRLVARARSAALIEDERPGDDSYCDAK